MKIFIIFLLGYLEFFNVEAMSRSAFDDIYSGNLGAARTATYIYLCTKTNNVSEAEGCIVRTARNFAGPDGCCESCSTYKNGLFLAAITVDESDGEFSGHRPQKLIWSGAFNFYQKESSCCAYEANLGFCYAYKSTNVQDGEMVYSSEKRDRFVKLFPLDRGGWFHPCDDILTLSEYPHMRSKDGKIETILYGLDYEGPGGLFHILQTSLVRWRFPSALTISEFLKYAGSIGTVENGVCIAPRHAGSWIFSGGYNCVAFCDALLQKIGLLSSHKLRFKREELLKCILDEQNAQVIVHDRRQHESLGNLQTCSFDICAPTSVSVRDRALLFWKGE